MPTTLTLALLGKLAAANAALVLGGAVVGASLARAVTRRRYEAELAAVLRAHGQRVRQLEAGRLEALAELGRAAAELAERDLADGRKADRRSTVGLEAEVEVAPTPATVAAPEEAAPLATLVPAVLPLEFDAPAAWVGPRPLDDRLASEPEGASPLDAAAGDLLPPELRAVVAELAATLSIEPAPPPASPVAPPRPTSRQRRAEGWSLPIVPLPRTPNS